MSHPLKCSAVFAKTLIGLACLLAFISDGVGQENPFLGYGSMAEFIDSSQHYEYQLIPLQKQGALVVQQGFSRKWIIHRYDSQLVKQYTTQFRFATKQVLRHTDQIGTTLYMLTRAQHAAYHQLILLNIENGEMESIHIPKLLPMEFKTFHVLPPKVYMTGTVDRKPVVTQFDMDTRRNKILPAAYQKRQFIDQALKDKLGRYVLVVRQTDAKKKGLDVRIYSPESDQPETHFVAFAPDFNPDYLLAIDSTHLLGTFYTSNMDYPQGIFSQQMKGSSPPRRTFFKDFSGYVQHLSPREKQRYLRRKSKEVRKGQLPIIHQSMLVKPYPVSEKLVGISAENYHPYYESSQLPYSSSQGTWAMGSIMVGYQFNWLLTALADMEGNLIWNQTAARKGVRTLDISSPTDFVIADKWWMASWQKDGGLAYFLGNKDSLLVDKKELRTEQLARLTRFRKLNLERIIQWDKNILLGIGKASVKEPGKSTAQLHWLLVKIEIGYDDKREE